RAVAAASFAILRLARVLPFTGRFEWRSDRTAVRTCLLSGGFFHGYPACARADHRSRVCAHRADIRCPRHGWRAPRLRRVHRDAVAQSGRARGRAEPYRSALDDRRGLRAERLRHAPDGHALAGGELLAHHAAALHPGARHRLHVRAALDGGAQRGADLATAEQQAWEHLYQMVQRQALLLSFIDNFWWLAWIFAAVIPFVLFLGHRPRLGEPPAGVERHAAIVES